jgi:hypothetical protein
MEIIRVDMDEKDFTVSMFSDLHYGAVNCHRDLIRELISEAYEYNKYLVNLGDNIEAITPNDKRYAHASMDVQNNLMTPQQQCEEVIADFHPVRERLLSWGEGNHEAKLWNVFSPGQYMSDALDCAYGGYTYVMQFFHRDKLMFKWFCSHGSGRLPKGAKDPIQRLANRKAHLRRRLEATGFTDTILMAMGHTHQLLIVDPTIDQEKVLVTSDEKVKQDRRHSTDQSAEYISPERRWYVNTGSFLKLYSDPGTRVVNYAEMAMLEPTSLGWVDVEVVDGQVVNVKTMEG